jgi:hypothetical protein
VLVSDLLMKGLQSSRTELEAGLADAEAELAQARERCHQLEDLIAVGKATLYAAQLNPSYARVQLKETGAAATRPDESSSSGLRVAPSQK